MPLQFKEAARRGDHLILEGYCIVKSFIPAAAAVVLLLKGAGAASAAELPAYEMNGLPVSSHQVSVLGSAGVDEAPSTPTSTLRDMPASPHQIAVLALRRQVVRQLAATPEAATVGLAAGH
jgi:hypothetical protein